MRFMQQTSRKGFTIVELAVVVIIVAVLASIALPRLFRLIESSHSVEAINSIKAIEQSVVRCIFMCQAGGYEVNQCGCNKFDVMDIDDPGGSVNAHFDYSVTNPVPFGGGSKKFYFYITAKRTTRGGYIPSANDEIKAGWCPACGDAIAIKGKTGGVYQHVRIGNIALFGSY